MQGSVRKRSGRYSATGDIVREPEVVQFKRTNENTSADYSPPLPPLPESPTHTVTSMPLRHSSRSETNSLRVIATREGSASTKSVHLHSYGSFTKVEPHGTLGDRVSSTLSRSFSFISFGPAPTPLSLSQTTRPPIIRIHKSASTARSTTNSIDSQRTLVGAAKLTKKWPKPQSIRSIDMRRTLEEGRGLGVEKMERWTRFKWCLLISVLTVLSYGVAALFCAILTWYRTWTHSDVMYVADNDILILLTMAGSILVFSALLGLTGTILNSRPILATYSLLLWPALISLLAIGYASYKRYAFSLDHKLNLAWSQYYTPLGRLLIQNSLHCCGFYSPVHEATTSKRCYPRTLLPGCKGKLYRFEKQNLITISAAVFSIVAFHLLNITVALLCSNHITKTFGKGITPRQYRLNGTDVRVSSNLVSRPGLSRAGSSAVLREDRI